MPNSLTLTGLTVATRAELVAQFTTSFQTIYGDDINLDPDTPDGQLMNIFIQSVLDLEDLLVQIYNGFDPDNAIGIVLDQRVSINGIQRLAGTYTLTNITVVASAACTLYGLDRTDQSIYTVADNAGNQWNLTTTQVISGAGTSVYEFQSAVIGAVLTSPNTITTPVTIILGVQSVNNPTTYTTLGVNEESDYSLKVRRQKSVALSSQGYLSGLLAALENVTGVTFAKVWENVTGSTDGDGIPSHSIWVIVAGTAADADIAQAIYVKRNAGCGMKGSTTYDVVQADGSSFEVKWDEVTTLPLFIKFTATSLDGVHPPDIAAIRSGLTSSYIPGVAAQVNINELGRLVQAIDANTLVTSAGFSLTSGGAYTNTYTPTTKDEQFVVTSADTILLTMILSAPGVAFTIVAGVVTGTTVSIASGGTTLQFTGLGGFGAYTYSKVSGAGSINGASGLYISAGAGTDVLRVTDTQSHTADCTLTVS